MLAAAVKMMGSMSPDEITRGFIGLAGTVVAIGAVLTSFGLYI